MDRVLITMPKEPREFLLAVPVIQAYVYEYIQEVSQGLRDQNFQFTFRMDYRYAKYEEYLKVVTTNFPNYDYTGWNGLQRSEFNCFIDFDFELADELATRSGRHIVEAFGVLIGCTPRKRLTPLSSVSTQGKGIVIINWNEDEQCRLKNMISDKNISLLDSLADPIEQEIETAETVIGPAGALTYLAASYNRKVIEIFPDVKSYRLYNNEGVTCYQAIIGNASAADVFDAWQQMSEFDGSLVF